MNDTTPHILRLSDRVPINSYKFVTDRLAVGGDAHMFHGGAGVVVSMKRDGITHILDCRAEYSHRRWGGTPPEGFEYRANPTEDDGWAKPGHYFRESVRYVLEALAAPHNKVLVHCAMGINRGPSNLYAVLRVQGHTAEQATRLILQARPQALIIYKDDVEQALREGIL